MPKNVSTKYRWTLSLHCTIEMLGLWRGGVVGDKNFRRLAEGVMGDLWPRLSLGFSLTFEREADAYDGGFVFQLGGRQQ
jgi:hypothetical protein